MLVVPTPVDLDFYADDSGGPGAPYLVLAGLLATPSQWEGLCTAWQRVLNEHPRIPHSHMCKAWDFKDEEGPFCALTVPQRAVKLLALSEIASRHAVRGIATYLDLRTFNRNLEATGIPHVDPAMDSPYHHCYRTMSIMLGVAAAQLGWVGKIHLFMEKQATRAPERPAAQSFAWSKAGIRGLPPRAFPLPNPAWAMTDLFFSHLGSLRFIRGKAESPPLQAADMFAWHINRRLIGKGKPPETWANMSTIESVLAETTTEHTPTPRMVPWADFLAEPPIIDRISAIPEDPKVTAYLRKISEDYSRSKTAE